jgi:hypothetical protein
MSMVLACLMIETIDLGLAQTRVPSKAQQGVSTSNPVRISEGEE